MPKLNSSPRFELDHDGNVVNGTAALCQNQDQFLTLLFSQFGWKCDLLDKHGSRRHFSLRHSGGAVRDVIVYSGTIRDESRNPYEKKIQLGSNADPRQDDRSKTIILGIYFFEETDTCHDAVIVGFPINASINYPSNPSLRGGVMVNDILQKAKINGLYVDHRSQNVAFRSEFIYYYLDNYNRFHYKDGVGDETSDSVKIEGLDDEPLQSIRYGAPGTGKSKGVNDVASTLSKEDVVRTTFHPDSDYSTFVGAYKPKMDTVPLTRIDGDEIKKVTKGDVSLLTEKHISYEFVPQSFAKAYVQAWKRVATPLADGKIAPVMLVIEEINRGDCAKVFGDLFQLLDRRVKDDDRNPNDPIKKIGFSEYPVLADSDLADYIRRELNDVKDAITNAGYGTVIADENLQLVLPPNMYIWATMNTSDQSLFPMDSAFKRRWDWKYTPIKDEGKDWKIKFTVPAYTKGGQQVAQHEVESKWWDFLKVVNEEVLTYTNSEDKQLGYFFVKPTGDVIDAEMFVNKVMFFLWNAVFKDCYTECDYFKNGDKHYTFKSFFKDDGAIDVIVLEKFLGELMKKSGSTV